MTDKQNTYVIAVDVEATYYATVTATNEDEAVSIAQVQCGNVISDQQAFKQAQIVGYEVINTRGI